MVLLAENFSLQSECFFPLTNKRQRIPQRQSKMENPEKLAIQGIQDEGKNTTQYVLDTTMRKQTQITDIIQTAGGRGKPNIVLMRKT